MRLFFSLNFSPETVRAMEDVQRRLKAFAPSGVYPPPQNLHLTLAFLGEVPDHREGEVRNILESLSPVPMVLEFSRVGKFTQGDKELWWLGAQPCPELETLRAHLISRLELCRFSPDRKPFRPHVTLARKVMFPGRVPCWEELLPREIQAPCGRVSLMRSRLTPTGAVYWELAGKAPL